MTTPPDRDTLIFSVLQNVLHVADTTAARRIRDYADQHAIADLEEISDPYEPSLTPGQAHQAAPSLGQCIERAVDNPDNRSPFAIKASDILATVTVDASSQAREELPRAEWTALVRAAATELLSEAGATEHERTIFPPDEQE